MCIRDRLGPVADGGPDVGVPLSDASAYGVGDYAGSGLGARASQLDANDCANLADFEEGLPAAQ
eukprot:6176855-Alexandrium_andersonii.AAC.1